MSGLWQRQWGILGMIAVALSVLVTAFGTSHTTALYLDQAAARGQNTLGLAVAVLRGHLSRYETLPELIADHERIRDLLSHPDDPGRIDEANRYLEAINAMLEASDIYVLLPDGTTLAASNHAGPVSFIGENFNYRPYFLDAITGGQGRFFALGTTSLTRGYYFGAPVRVGDEILGVVVFKVDIDAIERSWIGGDYEIIVTDPEGIIFMSGQSDWHFAAIQPLTDDRLARTAETRRYADAELRELQVTRHTSSGGHELLSVTTENGTQEYLMVAEAMPEAAWTVKVLLDTASARAQALTTMVALVLLIALGTTGAAVFLQRRARLAERLQVQREAQEQLERRVDERTADLAAVNRRLEEEVAERRATERALRKTQSDLVQAGKLAALGQMSAALSHEFNQPLAAARAYADNAAQLMERARLDEARQNIDRIGRLIERMGAISRHLRNFARKPNARLRPVDLAETVQDAQEIAAWRLRAADVTLDVDLGPEPLLVRAGAVRLQQVLVNILSNAADAVEGRPGRRITLTARREDEQVVIRIRDNGPGIPPAIAARIFDPFFTTKGVGKGLGLGLSISYNIIEDFGGNLSVSNPEEGGAEFRIELAAVDGTPAVRAAE